MISSLQKKVRATWRKLLDASGRIYPPEIPFAPASREDISQLEVRLKGIDCEDFLAGFEVVDGYHGLFVDGRFGVVGFFNAKQVCDDWPTPVNVDAVPAVRRSEKGVRRRAYHPTRVAFAWSDYWIFFLDYDPGKGGKKGQVVAVHTWDEYCVLVTPSYLDFLEQGLSSLREVAPPNRD